MQMDAGLDTGAMLLTEKTPIAPADTTTTLHDRLADLGGRMIVEALELAGCGGLTATPQPCTRRHRRGHGGHGAVHAAADALGIDDGRRGCRRHRGTGGARAQSGSDGPAA